jgi:hypothetical protein
VSSNALLLARIESLQENVKRVDLALERLQAWHSDSHDVILEDDFWMHLNKQVRQQFRRQRRILADLHEKLVKQGQQPVNTAEAWETYAAARDDSERLFEESLEFIGGLTFRLTGLDDERVFELADQLIVTCAREAYAEPWHFLTVPSLREVVTKSRARLSRIRFPEWTIWTLPLTAYVLGHEVMEEHDIAPLVSRRMEAWARQDVAHRHLHVLLADIFGAYIMGPAFGHASIWLHFDPSRAHIESVDHPAERSRAHVILRTLASMEGHEDNAWANSVSRLQSQWNAALAGASPPDEWQDDPASLDELVVDTLTHFDEESTLTMEAAYSPLNWTEAKRLYQQWRGDALGSQSHPLSTEPDTLTGARDVLNAAWLQRLEFPNDTPRVEQAAAETCKKVLFRGRTGPAVPGQDPVKAR